MTQLTTLELHKGITQYFSTQKEAATFLEKSPAAISKAIKNNGTIIYKNHTLKISTENIKTVKQKYGILLLKQGRPKYLFEHYGKMIRLFYQDYGINFLPIIDSEYDIIWNL